MKRNFFDVISSFIRGSGAKSDVDSEILQYEEELRREDVTVFPPHENWTAVELNQALYFNGKHVPFPFCLDDLGDDYTFGDDPDYDESISEMFVTVNYNGEPFGLCVVPDVKPEEISRTSLVNNMTLSDLNEKTDSHFNGIGIGNKFSDVIKKIGNPKKIETDLYVYDYNDGNEITKLSFSKGAFNRISSMTFSVVPSDYYDRLFEE